MSNSIIIDEAVMLKKIEELKYQKKRMDDVLEKFKGDTLKINDYWNGKTGETVHDEMNDYVNDFDYISSKLEGQIAVLERAVERHKRMNTLTTSHIEQNSSKSAL